MSPGTLPDRRQIVVGIHEDGAGDVPGLERLAGRTLTDPPHVGHDQPGFA